MSRCTACRFAVYCSKRCQKSDWEVCGHNSFCKFYATVWERDDAVGMIVDCDQKFAIGIAGDSRDEEREEMQKAVRSVEAAMRGVVNDDINNIAIRALAIAFRVLYGGGVVCAGEREWEGTEFFPAKIDRALYRNLSYAVSRMTVDLYYQIMSGFVDKDSPTVDRFFAMHNMLAANIAASLKGHIATRAAELPVPILPYTQSLISLALLWIMATSEPQAPTSGYIANAVREKVREREFRRALKAAREGLADVKFVPGDPPTVDGWPYADAEMFGCKRMTASTPVAGEPRTTPDMYWLRDIDSHEYRHRLELQEKFDNAYRKDAVVIMTQNMHGRIYEMSYAGYNAHFYDSQVYRASLFACLLRYSNLIPDIICFQELNNDEAYEKMKDLLKPGTFAGLRYPPLSLKDIAEGTGFEVAAGRYSTKRYYNSGLVIFYNPARLELVTQQSCGQSECFAAFYKEGWDMKDISPESIVEKGIQHAAFRVMGKNNVVHVFNMHPHAYVGLTFKGYNVVDGVSVRRWHKQQMAQAARFIEEHTKEKHIAAYSTTFVCGDFNVNRYAAAPNMPDIKKPQERFEATAASYCSAEIVDTLHALQSYQPPTVLDTDRNHWPDVDNAVFPPASDEISGRRERYAVGPAAGGIFTWDGLNNSVTINPRWPMALQWIDYVLVRHSTLESYRPPLYADNRVIRLAAPSWDAAFPKADTMPPGDEPADNSIVNVLSTVVTNEMHGQGTWRRDYKQGDADFGTFDAEILAGLPKNSDRPVSIATGSVDPTDKSKDEIILKPNADGALPNYALMYRDGPLRSHVVRDTARRNTDPRHDSITPRARHHEVRRDRAAATRGTDSAGSGRIADCDRRTGCDEIPASQAAGDRRFELADLAAAQLSGARFLRPAGEPVLEPHEPGDGSDARHAVEPHGSFPADTREIRSLQDCRILYELQAERRREVRLHGQGFGQSRDQVAHCRG